MEDIIESAKQLVQAFKKKDYEIAGFADFPEFDQNTLKKIKQYFRNSIWNSFDFSIDIDIDERNAIVLYLVLRAAQKHYNDEGEGFYPKFGEYIGSTGFLGSTQEQDKLAAKFRGALKHFDYYCPEKENFRETVLVNLMPILVHAGIPDSALEKFIPFVDHHSQSDFQRQPERLYKTVRQTSYPLQRNVKRIFELGLRGAVEIWKILTDAITHYRQTQNWEEAKTFLRDLPPAISRDKIGKILRCTSAIPSGMDESPVAPPKIRFHPETRCFEITSRKKPVFENDDFLMEINENPYRARFRRPPPTNEVMWKNSLSESQFQPLSLYHHPEGTEYRLMIFDTKSFRLIPPEEIERHGVFPTKYYVFADACIECGCPRPSEWDIIGWFGAEIDFSDASHQRHSGGVNYLAFQCGNNTIRIKQSRCESSTIEYLDVNSNQTCPLLERVACRLSDMESETFVPLFEKVANIRFSRTKTETIQLLRFDNKMWKFVPCLVVKKSPNNVFSLNTRLPDGLYRVQDENSTRIHDHFAILANFGVHHVNYSEDGKTFELKLQVPLTGTLKEPRKCGRHRIKTLPNGSEQALFSMPTRYPLLSFDWEWTEQSLGSFTMSWPLHGLRWRIISKSGNSYEEDWTTETIIVDKKQTNIHDSVLEVHFPNTTKIKIGNKPISLKKKEFGGEWHDLLTRYQHGDSFDLECAGEEFSPVLFMEQPLLDSLDIRFDGDVDDVKIVWKGVVPQGSVLLIWEPQKPGSTFHEIPLAESNIQSQSALIGLEYVHRSFCYTIASKKEIGISAGYYLALDRTKYRKNQKTTKSELFSQGCLTNLHLLTFYQQLFNKNPDGDSWIWKWIRNWYDGCTLEGRQNLLPCLAAFMPELKLFVELPLVRRPIGCDSEEIVLELERCYQKLERLERKFSDRTNLGWMPPYKIAEADFRLSNGIEKAEVPLTVPYPIEYFRDLWLISTPYRESKISAISKKEYARMQINALDSLTQTHLQYGLPEVKTLISFLLGSKFILGKELALEEDIRLEKSIIDINFQPIVYSSPQNLGLGNACYHFLAQCTQRGYKFRYFQLHWQHEDNTCHLDEFFPYSNRLPHRLKTGDLVPLKTMIPSKLWMGSIRKSFQQTLINWSVEFSQNLIPEFDASTENNLQERIASIIPNEHPIQIFFDFVSHGMLRICWLLAVLGRLFVNDKDTICAKTGDGGRELEEYLHRHYKILLGQPYFQRIQMLAELAVRVGWLGGIGIVAKTEYDSTTR